MRLSASSIGTKIFGAFFVLSLIVGALGAYSFTVLNAAGNIVADTYDGPLMAINYARAAAVDFSQMQNVMLRRHFSDAKARAALDRQIDDISSTFFGDLAVAQERSVHPDELKVIVRLKTLVTRWDDLRRADGARLDDPKRDALDAKILDGFDMLIELNADYSFIDRRKSVSSVGYYKYLSMAMTGLALLLAVIITAFLGRRIINPLKSAARVADRIAHGELQTPIPPGGRDETGTLLNSMTVMQDNIREMVARETARAHSAEGRLVSALETSREGVLLVSSAGRILVANAQMRSFFPHLADELAPGNELAVTAGVMQAHLAEGSLLPSLEEIGISRAGAGKSAERQLRDGRWVRVTGSRTPDGDLFIFLSDFTAIKEREENFRRAKQAAETANAAKTRFLANMSHELRTPLNAIIGFSEIISGQIFGAIANAKYVDYATDIMRSGRHLLDVINSVLDLSRSEAGKMELKGEVVDLRYILRDAAKIVREQCRVAGLTLSFNEPAGELPVWGEKSKLRQIVLNLLSNAIKFTDAGGAVSIAVKQSDSDITVEVFDTGIGMSEADLEVAFTPFAQVDDRLARRYEGAGLGLPLTKALVDLHGGELTLESIPGVGTKARVRFARAVAQEDGEAERAAS
ncbi:MAG TPA: ATP-binding protein [Rhizomicrobium sp.]|jgi:signal transduction histidine kinase/HAMP domain-containing protein|nr:ATP-binding protein [Rhizomicrobium sp.]